MGKYLELVKSAPSPASPRADVLGIDSSTERATTYTTETTKASHVDSSEGTTYTTKTTKAPSLPVVRQPVDALHHRVLNMSLEEFAQSGLQIEIRVPGCGQTLWWVGTSRDADQLMQRGILAKETHEQVVRFAPPLVVEKSDLVWALEQIGEVLGAVSPVHH